MEIQIAALCDSAADYNGKLCILGTFDTIMSQSFPFFHPQCSIALRMIFRDDDEGRLALKINIVDEDGVAVVPPIEGDFEIEIPTDAAFATRNGVFNLQHLKFERPGNYSIDVMVNNKQMTGIPFRILEFGAPGSNLPEN